MIDARHQKLLNIARDRWKALKKEKEKRKLGKLSNKINKYIITFTFSYRKNYILLENIFAYLKKIILYYYICITIFSRGRLLEMQ